MKKLLAVLVVVALALVAVSAANAAISTTRHNLSSASSNTVKGNIDEICIYCHTPHGGAQADGQPLWNRNASTQVLSYNPYTSLTLSNVPTTGNAASQLCFSCHDGVTSINSLLNRNGAPYTGAPVFVSGSLNIGGDGQTLTNDHPIGMAIPTAKAGYQAAVALAPYLVGGIVECSTCHAVHGAGFSNLLRMDNAGSLLCLDCHVK